MVNWREDFFEARYHLSVAERMLKTYDEFPDKRVMVGVIREGAKAAGKLVRAFLIRENRRGNLKTFLEWVAPKYLDLVTIRNLVKMLEVERMQRLSRVEFSKNNRILLLVDGEWKILRISRLRELVGSIRDVIGDFPTDIKR